MSSALPFTVSRSATARVKNPLPAPTTCPNCGGTDIKIAHHDEIYGRAFSDWPWAYKCTGCGASVGMHPHTKIPLGTLATESLRKARKRAKAPFEQLWRPDVRKRSEAYAALAKHLGIPVAECHFGWFDIIQCDKAQAWALQELERRRRLAADAQVSPARARQRGEQDAREGVQLAACPFVDLVLVQQWQHGWRAVAESQHAHC